MPVHSTSSAKRSEAYKGRPLDTIRCRVAMFSAEADAHGEGWPVPEWIHLCPAGELVEGRDGRGFKVESPQAVLEGTEPEMFADIDHESFSWDGSTEAKGWVQELVHLDEAEEDGPRKAPGFWARMKWTAEGRELIASGKFRGISPVVRVRYDTDENGYLVFPGTAIGFARAFALTNLPNLDMTLLNRAKADQSNEAPQVAASPNKETKMNETLIALAAKMGLQSDATEKDLDQAFRTLTAERDEAVTELHSLRTQIAEVEALRFTESVDHAFAEAAKSGRMAPAEEAAFRRVAKDADGLETFKAIMAARPERMSADREEDPQVDPPAVSKTLTDLQREIAAQKGLSEEEYLEGLKG